MGLLAIIILLLKIWKTRSCAGISGRSQVLFLIVFVSRYLDLVTNFVSVYNTVMKIFFIASAAGTVYLMFIKFKATYDGNHDTFRVEFLLAPVAILALVLNHEFSVMEVLWTFSIYLESVAILPLCSWFPRLAKQRPSRRTIYLLLALIVHSTFSTGSTDITLKVSMISLLSLPELFKLSSTAISSTFM